MLLNLIDFNLRGHSNATVLQWELGWVPAEISVTRVHVSTLLALRGGGWVSNLRKNALRNT